MSFGEEFHRFVLGPTEPPVPGTVSVANRHNPTAVRAALQAAITYALDVTLPNNRARGATIYIPPLPDEQQLWLDVSGGFTIPENITLMFAPGAQLVPMVSIESAPGDHALMIMGNLRCPLGKIWIVNSEFSNPVHRLCPVRLLGRLHAHVYPEWWGTAFPDQALAAAIRAATTDRRNLSGPSLRALDIEFNTTWEISTPLVVSRGPDNLQGGVTLRGLPGGNLSRTLVCSNDFPTNQPMLRLEGYESVTLEDMHLDAKGRAMQCVTLTTSRSNVAERGSTLRRSSFVGTASLVEINVTNSMTTTPLLAGSSYDDLFVDGCVFRPTYTNTPYTSTLGMGLNVSGPASVGLDVKGCVFEGVALSMIQVRSCALSLGSTLFRNTATTPVNTTHERGPQGGLDVYLGQRTDNEPAATIYAQDIHSTSSQFLSTCATGPANSGRDCALISVHHVGSSPRWDLGSFWVGGLGQIPKIPPDKLWDPPPDGKGPFGPIGGSPFEGPFQKPPPQATSPTPPPIEWHIPASTGAWLSLTGCRFDGLTGALPAVMAYGECGRVVDQGILTGSTLTISHIGSATWGGAVAVPLAQDIRR
jgi:hypothetical protein